MYSTCIFCHADLGKNDSIEHFPVGRRLAFDAARGRLWVVCRRCERWNLTPIEERWEALEECERLFAGTKLRVSTEEIGLARLREGLELVRIGKPQRPEMAAWRYGDQFGRRRRRSLTYVAAFGGLGAALALAQPIFGVAASSVAFAFNVTMATRNFQLQRRRLARVSLPDRDAPIDVLANSLRTLRIAPYGDDWALAVSFEKKRSSAGKLLQAFRAPNPSDFGAVVIHGDEALRVASTLLPAINQAGGNKNEVRSAVDLIERSQNAHALFNSFVIRRKSGYGKTAPRLASAQPISELPTEARLALEMMTHEDAERRALEGELGILEDAWREAEEVAAIADKLLLGSE